MRISMDDEGRTDALLSAQRARAPGTVASSCRADAGALRSGVALGFALDHTRDDRGDSTTRPGFGRGFSASMACQDPGFLVARGCGPSAPGFRTSKNDHDRESARTSGAPDSRSWPLPTASLSAPSGS